MCKAGLFIGDIISSGSEHLKVVGKKEDIYYCDILDIDKTGEFITSEVCMLQYDDSQKSFRVIRRGKKWGKE